MLGVWDQISGQSTLLTLPIAVWEFFFGVYMTFKSFKLTAASDEPSTPVNSATFAEVVA